jgi:hypothetical protein
LSQLSLHGLLPGVALRVQRLPEPCIAAHGIDVEFGAPAEQCVSQRRVGADLGDVAADEPATSMTAPPVQIPCSFSSTEENKPETFFIRSTTTNGAGFFTFRRHHFGSHRARAVTTALGMVLF